MQRILYFKQFVWLSYFVYIMGEIQTHKPNLPGILNIDVLNISNKTKKSHIQETQNLSTCSSADTIKFHKNMPLQKKI